ncbi:unnamed protein product [Lasius platythorax]|uniref:Uncharacterized protein n=1 Tax=Lasius platythorax TaxID=488582 RepID=A0AAV2NQE8_9HYME
MEITEPEDSEETVAKETSIFSPTSVTVVLTDADKDDGERSLCSADRFSVLSFEKEEFHDMCEVLLRKEL